MSNITIVKGSLFDAPKDSIICHAVNCQGVWGNGIAKQFKDRFPDAYKVYHMRCKADGANLLGSCLLIPTQTQTIGCLFTSISFGGNVDSVPEILDATSESLQDLIFQNTYPSARLIHMCKINSGLFGVPWDYTAEVLEEFKSQNFTVWEP